MKKLPEIVDNREVAYEALFAGEIPFEPQLGVQDIGISGLWRIHTQKLGGNGRYLDQHLEKVPDAVLSILEEQESIARTADDEGEAIFSTINQGKTLPIVADITSKTVGIWEKALYRNGYRPILSTPSDYDQTPGANKDERLAHLLASKSLVIETASAVLQVLPLWANKPFEPTLAEKKKLAKVLANWGPQFLTDWMNGNILTTWTEAQGISESEAREYHEIFTHGLRRDLAVNRISDPLSALDNVAANLELMTDEAIAERLGWTAEEARDTISPSMRKYLAVGYLSDPLSALDNVAANLELMTDEAIAERLGWTAEEARDAFRPSDRKRFAINYISDPLAGLNKVATNLMLMTDEAIAERLGWTAEEARDAFRPSDLKRIAINYISNPLVALDKVAANLALMTDEVIAARLGWKPEEARELIKLSVRKYMAVYNISDPLSGIEQLVAGEISIKNRPIASIQTVV